MADDAKVERPLTYSCFQQWVRDEFVPHITHEHVLHDRMLLVEESIKSWVKVIGVASAVATVLIGIIISLLVWSLQEKNNELYSLRLAQMTNQEAMTTMLVKQNGVLAVLERNRNRDERITDLISKLQETLLTHIQGGHSK